MGYWQGNALTGTRAHRARKTALHPAIRQSPNSRNWLFVPWSSVQSLDLRAHRCTPHQRSAMRGRYPNHSSHYPDLFRHISPYRERHPAGSLECGSSCRTLEAHRPLLKRSHVSVSIPAGFPSCVRARLLCRLSSRHGLRSSGDGPSLLVQAARPVLAERLTPPPSSSTAEVSTERCSCTRRSATSRRVAQAAKCANQFLLAAPIPLKSILDLLPRTAGARATHLLQAMAVGASLCDLIANEVGSHASSAVPCQRCARRSRARE